MDSKARLALNRCSVRSASRPSNLHEDRDRFDKQKKRPEGALENPQIDPRNGKTQAMRRRKPGNGMGLTLLELTRRGA